MAHPVKPPEDFRSYSMQNTTVKTNKQTKKYKKVKAQLSAHIKWQINFWMELMLSCGKMIHVWLRPKLLTINSCSEEGEQAWLVKNTVFSPSSSVQLTGSWLVYSCGPWAPEHSPPWQQTTTSIRTFNAFHRDIWKLDSPWDNPWYSRSSQTLDGSIDLQVLLQSDPGPQRVHLWTVAYVLQRAVCVMKLRAVVSHQHLLKKKRIGFSCCDSGSDLAFLHLLQESDWREQRAMSVPDLLWGQCHLTTCAWRNFSLLRWGPTVQELHLEM